VRQSAMRMALAMAVFVALVVGTLVLPGSTAVASGVPFQVGDVFAAVGNGKYAHYSPTGVLLDKLDSETNSLQTAGMAFDAAGNLYGANFNSGSVSKFDTFGNLLGQFAGGPGPMQGQAPESIVRDSAGNFYVGQAGPGVFQHPAHPLLKFDANGNLLAEFSPAMENRGVDWIDLASDQCTLLYTSEGVRVMRFDVCQNKQLSDFASLPLIGPEADGGEVAFALRIRPNGEVLVAAWTRVLRLDPAGNIMQEYRLPGVGVVGTSILFALNLDPDGTSFWTAEQETGKTFKVDIATGDVLTQFTAPPEPNAFPAVAGLAVFGELTSALPRSIDLTPTSASRRVGDSVTLTAKLIDFVAPAGTPVTFTVTGANPQTQTATADANGNATLTYTGANAGTDTVVAAAGGVTSNTSTITWHNPHTTLLETSDLSHAGAPFTTTFTYAETNDGTDPIGNVSVGTSLCGTPTYVSGDGDNNAVLDPGETWVYSCTKTFTLPGTYTDTTTATGTDTVDNLAAPTESASLTVTAYQPSAPLTPGYWKNHRSAMSPLLPLYLGSYKVGTTAMATAVFTTMNCSSSSAQGVVGCLAGELLAAELNVANNSSNACIYTTINAASAFLKSVGYLGPSGTYTLTSAQRSTALSLSDRLSQFNEGKC
jgi:hypothetical protein